jgi:hypothetical protein
MFRKLRKVVWPSGVIPSFYKCLDCQVMIHHDNASSPSTAVPRTLMAYDVRIFTGGGASANQRNAKKTKSLPSFSFTPSTVLYMPSDVYFWLMLELGRTLGMIWETGLTFLRVGMLHSGWLRGPGNLGCGIVIRVILREL